MIASKVFPTIYNNSNYRVKNILSYHPESMKYISYWRMHKKRVFEGCWIPDTKDVNIDLNAEIPYTELLAKGIGNWRWIPPGLYFYLNFGTILHKPENAPRTAPKQRMRPYLSDLELAFFYNWVEARGFSGFEDDEEYTCNRDLIIQDLKVFHPSCYNAKGELKKYIPAREYLRKLSDKPLGRHLYFNEAKNLMLLGSRGGGKSWLSAIHVLLHEIITDGSKYYTEETLKNPPLNEIFVGAGIASKSAELTSKVEIGMNHIPGVWKKGTPEQVPSPLFKHMSGSLAPNNIKNPWTHSYDKKIAGSWQKFGTGSNLKHGVFTTENPEATAGGRYSVIVIEEVGLMNNVLTAHGSSEATQMTDGTDKYGSTLYIGTGGNVDKIVEAEIIFRDPEGFNMLAFDDEWENTGKIGWFVPAYYMDRKYKDAEGNTILDKAVGNYEERRKLKKKAKSSSALDLEMMNYPLIPSEMFLTKTSNNYPIADLKHRLAELSTNSKLLNSTWKGKFQINSDGKVEWKTTDDRPIREFPLKSDYNNMEGACEMFYPPQSDDNQEIASGRYIAACLPPGEKVITENGIIKIEDVTLKDKLINEKGDPVKIKKLIKYNVVDEDIYTIKVANTLKTTTFTKEHPILSSTVTKGWVSSKRAKRLGINQRIKHFDFKYTPVEQLTTEHWIKTPNIYKSSNSFDINTLWNSDPYRIDRKVESPLNKKDFWWFIGLWLGDGWALENSHRISISFNEKETQYIEKFAKITKELFNRKVNYKTKNGSTIATFTCTQLSIFLTENFGKYALYKKIPEWVKRIDNNLKLNLILGYLDSDGSVINKKYISTEFVSINLNLLESVQDILFSLGIISSIKLLRDVKIKLFKHSDKSYISNTKKTYSLAIAHVNSLRLLNMLNFPENLKISRVDLTKRLECNTQKQVMGCYFSENLEYIYFKVEKIEKNKYSGIVYNFECDTNTFMCYHITTHNCDPIDEDDNSDVTTSLQSFLIMDTYLDRIVFEYSGRTKFAKDFYEQCRRALIYYKATLLYENQKKGVFTYFDTKNSLYLLADTPKALRDMDMQKISGVGNKTKGVYATPAINKWGREELGPAWMNSQAVGKPEGVTNAMVQNSPAFIREAILYNPNLNTDRISAFGILMIFRELRLKYVPKDTDKEIYTPDKDAFWDKIYNKGKSNSSYTKQSLFAV